MARKTKQEALETREKLLDAAEQLFLRQGVSGTSLQQIAAEAQLTRGAVYWHFRDKAELFDAMMRRGTMPLEQGVRADPSGPAREQPLTLVELRWNLANVFWSAANNERTRRVFEIAMQKVEYAGEMLGLHERKRAVRRGWLEENRAAFVHAVEQGQLPPSIDADRAAVTLMSLVDGLLHQWIYEPGSFDLVGVGTHAVEDFITGLARDLGPSLLPPLTADECARLGQAGACPASEAFTRE
ncbi:MAG: TetR family transcriptional regulator [Paucibacter sp.]|nr:TetR family transcriptional regulator [Roseateles sp.]